MMTDPIGDMLARMKNAQMRQYEKVTMPASRLKGEVARVLKTEGYIKDYKVTSPDKGKNKALTVYFKYSSDGKGVITHLVRVSKPGCRVYRKVTNFKKVMDGLGMCIISTSKGMMSDRECRKLKLGGEVICEIY